MSESSAAPESLAWPWSRPGCALTLALVGPAALALFAMGPNEPIWQSGEWSDYLTLFVRNASYVFAPLVFYSTICLGLAAFDRRKVLAYFAIRFGVYSGVLLSVQPVVLWTAFMLASPGGAEALLIFLAFIIFAGVFLPLAVARAIRDAARRHARWSPSLSAITLVVSGLLVLLGPLLAIALLFAAPLWTVAVYAIFGRSVYRRYGGHGQLRLIDLLGVLTWSSVYLASWRISVTLALEKYATLPKTEPKCYVCTAAARGHRRLVKSQPSRAADGGMFLVNQQMRRLKAAELALMTSLPRLHAALRAVYDHFGRRLAASMTHPLLADLAYVVLKPAEWLATALLRALLPRFDELAALLYRE